ncbi:hypothetical protein [Streptomyces sp. NPDC015131]|uniref:hypothetical protein n=1 Tax=Streptomyces sp. NPDC015131 TaxID=3364941 RepID=UPI0036F53089
MTRKAVPAETLEHGDERRYRRGCRCTLCKQGANKANIRRRYLRETGRGIWRSVDKAAHHILQLRAAGLEDRYIQKHAPVCPDVMYRILRREGRIHVKTETRILALPIPAVTPAITANRSHVPAHGTIRRLRALVAAGWHQAELARRLGKDKENLGQLIARDPRGNVTMLLEAEVKAVYAELHTLRPEDHGVIGWHAERARRHAAAKGWIGPDYWDDDEFDDPDFQPAVNEPPRYVVLAENAFELEDGQGYTRQQAADRLGVAKDTLQAAISYYRARQAEQPAA